MGYYNEINGDLLDLFDSGMFDAIGHGANCFCTMRSGIAGQIHKRFPEAYEADCQTVRGDRSKLGSYTNWKHSNGSYLFNLYTQFNYGRVQGNQYADYNAIRSALEGMRDRLEDIYPKRRIEIGLPQIGCGLAQGDWAIVKQIIRDVWHRHDVTVVIFDKHDPDQPQKLM